MPTVAEKVAELTRERDDAKALLSSRKDDVRRLQAKCNQLDNAIGFLDERPEPRVFPGEPSRPSSGDH